jgi:hypothetical protein
VIRIAISQAAFDALAATIPLGSVGYENAANGRGELLRLAGHDVVARLRAMRGHGESYSDVVLQLVETEARTGARGEERVR